MGGGLSWPWLNGSWIYNYLCNQCLTPLKLWVRISFRRDVLDTILCDKVCVLLVECLWFYPGTDRHDIIEILLKVGLNTLTHGRNMYTRTRFSVVGPNKYFLTFKAVSTRYLQYFMVRYSYCLYSSSSLNVCRARCLHASSSLDVCRARSIVLCFNCAYICTQTKYELNCNRLCVHITHEVIIYRS